jgi:hypothetical protein
MLAAATEGTRTYDLCINVAGRRLYWRNRNRGVTLGADTIAWTMDGEQNETAYGNVVAVHLDSSGQKVVTDRCTVSFADGRGLTIVNTDPGGYADAARAALYRGFVRDLHGRLAGRTGGIRFTEGWPLWRCQAMFALAGLIGIAAAALGVYMLLRLGDLRGPVLVAIAAFAAWKLSRTARNNLPRAYTPDRLPEFLLS